MNGQNIPYTAEEEAARDTEEANAIAIKPGLLRNLKYEGADEEFIKRGLIIGGWSVRGGSPKDRFTAASMKEVSKGGSKKQALENHHDNLDSLKDLIEAADDLTALEAIDVTDNVHWT